MLRINSSFDQESTPLLSVQGNTLLEHRYPQGFGIRLVNRMNEKGLISDLFASPEITLELHALLKNYGCVVIDDVNDHGLEPLSCNVFHNVNADDPVSDMWHQDNSVDDQLATNILSGSKNADEYIAHIKNLDFSIVLYCPDQNPSRSIPTLIADRKLVSQTLLMCVQNTASNIRLLSICSKISDAVKKTTQHRTDELAEVFERYGIGPDEAAEMFTLNALSREDTPPNIRAFHRYIEEQVSGVLRIGWKPNRAVIINNVTVAHKRSTVNPRLTNEQGPLSNYRIFNSYTHDSE